MKGLEIGNALEDSLGFGIKSGSQSGEQLGDSKHDQTRGGGWMDGQKNEQTNIWKISPFYRTSSPIGAAAQKAPYLNANPQAHQKRGGT